MIELELPFPPSVNMITTIAHGRKITSKRGREYREAALYSIAQAKVSRIECDVPIHVEIDLYPPTKQKRDIDNYSKAVLDALTEAKVYDDDSLITRLVVNKRNVLKGGKVLIKIEVANG